MKNPAGAHGEANAPLLEVRDLHVSFATYGGQVRAVRGVSFDVRRGECLAIVGESGCGKSVTAQSIMRLIPSPPGRITAGSMRFGGRDLARLSEVAMQTVRGAEIAMVFQDPMTSLNPTMTIGRQVSEGVRKHHRLTAAAARDRAMQMLHLVGIPQPEERVEAYPHQFSGGMRQRVMLAMAMASNPRLLIADEPTTALDVTVQAQILELMKSLQKQFQMSIILITHDLGVVAGMADRVAVMYAGEIVETGRVEDIFASPRHPYTWGLLNSIPRSADGEKQPLVGIPGSPPDLFAPPVGCGFAPRCPHSLRICHQEGAPELARAEDGRGMGSLPPAHNAHTARCWLEHPLAPRVPQPSARSMAAANADAGFVQHQPHLVPFQGGESS